MKKSGQFSSLHPQHVYPHVGLFFKKTNRYLHFHKQLTVLHPFIECGVKTKQKKKKKNYNFRYALNIELPRSDGGLLIYLIVRISHAENFSYSYTLNDFILPTIHSFSLINILKVYFFIIVKHYVHVIYLFFFLLCALLPSEFYHLNNCHVMVEAALLYLRHIICSCSICIFYTYFFASLAHMQN